jgi:hypothetical protein
MAVAPGREQQQAQPGDPRPLPLGEERGSSSTLYRARHPPCQQISLVGVTNLRGRTPPSASLAADPKPCTPPPPRRRPAWTSSAQTPATSNPTPCHKTSPCPRLCRQAPEKPGPLFSRRLQTPASTYFISHLPVHLRVSLPPRTPQNGFSAPERASGRKGPPHFPMISRFGN